MPGELTEIRPQLEQSLMAQAWTVAGDVLWAIERRNIHDLASSWLRLCRLRGVDFSAEPLPDSYAGRHYHELIPMSGDIWDRIQNAISATLRNADALDWLRHWKNAHQTVQSVLVAQAEHCGALTRTCCEWAASTSQPWYIPDGYEYGRLAAHYARLALGGGQ